jgi:hypothetical protein
MRYSSHAAATVVAVAAAEQEKRGGGGKPNLRTGDGSGNCFAQAGIMGQCITLLLNGRWCDVGIGIDYLGRV